MIMLFPDSENSIRNISAFKKQVCQNMPCSNCFNLTDISVRQK